MDRQFQIGMTLAGLIMLIGLGGCTVIDSRTDCPGFLSVGQNPFPDTLTIPVGTIYKQSLSEPPVFVHSENESPFLFVTSSATNIVVAWVNPMRDSVNFNPLIPGQSRINLMADIGAADCAMVSEINFFIKTIEGD